MDVRFVNPVLDAVVNVLSTMAQMTPQAGKPTIKPDSQARGVVTGLIDFSGKQVTVSTAISFPKSVVFEITKRMLRTEPKEVDEMVMDLVGEIANMMAGGAKASLEKEGYDFELTLPKVDAGEGHEVKHSISGPVVLLPFSTESGEFFVEICSD